MPRFASPQSILILLLAALAMLGPFSIDTVFPMFPEISRDLHVGNVEMQQTISVYLFAYGLMALLHGPLSDALGRKPVILWGTLIFAGASVGCALSTSIWQLLFWRAVQGVSAGSGLIVGRAIIRDRFHGSDAQKVMSRITMIFGIAPAIAPIIGGIVGTRLGWQAIFWLLAIFAVLVYVACVKWLEESHEQSHRMPLQFAPLFGAYWRMLNNRQFMLLTISGCFNFGAQFIYIASAPVFIMNILGYGPHDFWRFFIPMILGMMTGAWMSGKRAGRSFPAATIRLAYIIMIAAGVANLVYCLYAPRMEWPWAVLSVFGNGVGVALAFPTLTLMLLDLYPHERGTASSLQSFTSLMLNAVIAGVISPFLAHSAAHLAIGALCSTLLGLAAWLLYRHVSGNVAPGEQAAS
ncbi:multidrug effflux MFS transporter [Burkholderiaceae bacterium DAT-1]|nr:multidrug effflux MFS transporter [Burkholderiaceae bacterium DAT-1]